MCSQNKQLIAAQVVDSCGKSGRRETPQERSDEEAPDPPSESGDLRGNQQRCLTDTIFKDNLPTLPLSHILSLLRTMNRKGVKIVKLEQQTTIVAIVFFLFISTFVMFSYYILDKKITNYFEPSTEENGNNSDNNTSGNNMIRNNIDNQINGNNTTIENNVENSVDGTMDGSIENDIQNNVDGEGDHSLDNNISNNISVDVQVTVTNNVSNDVKKNEQNGSNDNGNNGGNGDEDGNRDDEEFPDLVWGVDSASLTTPDFYACVRENFGEPLVWGRYLGDKEGVSFGLTDDQVELIQSEGAKILLIYNQFEDGTGYENGRDQAQNAIRLAEEIGAPEGVAVFANVEPIYPIDSDFITGWYDVMTDSQYEPGIYGIFDPERDLYVEFNAAADANEEIRENTYLWTAAPNVGITTEAEAPEFNPTGPEGALVWGWQYGIDAETCNIDTNWFVGDLMDVLW